MRTYAKIMRGELHFPSHFSRASIDLIRRLLHPKPTKRLGVVVGRRQAHPRPPVVHGLRLGQVRAHGAARRPSS